jgi:hypothetical protein
MKAGEISKSYIKIFSVTQRASRACLLHPGSISHIVGAHVNFLDLLTQRNDLAVWELGWNALAPIWAVGQECVWLVHPACSWL